MGSEMCIRDSSASSWLPCCRVGVLRLSTSQEVAQGICEISGLSLVGEPKAMVVCFGGDKGVNIYKVVSEPDVSKHVTCFPLGSCA